MKKALIILSALLVIALSAGFVCAVDNGTVDVNMSGNKEISPDSFQLTFAVETQNGDAQKAIDENKKHSDVLYNTLYDF